MDGRFVAWLITAICIGLLYVVVAKRKLEKMPISKLKPFLSKKIPLRTPPQQTLARIEEYFCKKKYKTYYYDESRGVLILDSNSIGFFHWGFLFFLTCKQEELEIGIYPKGPNPPKEKVLQKYLDEFYFDIKNKL